jgi:DnaJ-class molecular chaperone
MTVIEREIERDYRVNRVINIIKDFELLFPEEFRKCDINRCGHCKGTGVKDKHQMTFCDWCWGVGYKGFEKIEGESICRTCNGYGCKKCKYKGTVDWITYATGSDITREKYI